jgi:hypothetical protein
MKKVILITMLVLGIWAAVELDKQMLLRDCVASTEGTDTDCAECYKKVYGTYPTD